MTNQKARRLQHELLGRYLWSARPRVWHVSPTLKDVFVSACLLTTSKLVTRTSLMPRTPRMATLASKVPRHVVSDSTTTLCHRNSAMTVFSSGHNPWSRYDRTQKHGERTSILTIHFRRTQRHQRYRRVPLRARACHSCRRPDGKITARRACYDPSWHRHSS